MSKLQHWFCCSSGLFKFSFDLSPSVCREKLDGALRPWGRLIICHVYDEEKRLKGSSTKFTHESVFTEEAAYNLITRKQRSRPLRWIPWDFICQLERFIFKSQFVVIKVKDFHVAEFSGVYFCWSLVRYPRERHSSRLSSRSRHTDPLYHPHETQLTSWTCDCVHRRRSVTVTRNINLFL